MNDTVRRRGESVWFREEHDVDECYLALRDAILKQARKDWHGKYNLTYNGKDDIIPTKEEMLEFIYSDWFEVLVETKGTKGRIDKGREAYIKSLGEFHSSLTII